VAKAWRNLKKRVLAFEQSLRADQRRTRTLLIDPVVIYPPIYDSSDARSRGDEAEPTLIGFKDAVTPKRGLQLAATAYATLEYQGDERRNRSVRCYGAIGVPMSLVLEAEKVNRAKDAFRDALRPLAGYTQRTRRKTAKGSVEIVTRDLITIMLRSIQEARVNVLAAYRHIPVFAEQVQRIHFQHVYSQSIQRKTAEEVIAMIGNRRDDLSLADLARLREISADEKLSRPWNKHSRLTVHVTGARRYLHPESGRDRTFRRVMPAELPVLFPIHASWPEPPIERPSFKHEAPTPPPGKPRRGRRRELEDEAFIVTLGFYRKRPEIREEERRKAEEARAKKARRQRKRSPDLFPDSVA